MITGRGLVSCVGPDVDALARAVGEGRSGLGLDPEMKTLGLRCRVSGRLADVDRAFREKVAVAAHELPYFARFARMGALAAEQALREASVGHAAIVAPDADRRAGVLVGSGAGPISEAVAQLRSVLDGVLPPQPGHAVARMTASFLPSFLGSRIGASRDRAVVSLACNSGLLALERSWRAVRTGEADLYLVGAVEEDDPYLWSSFDAGRVLARTPSDCPEPSCESRPFDRRACGVVPAGAAAFLVVESLASAAKRGAPILATIEGVHHEADASAGPYPSFAPHNHIAVVRTCLAEARRSHRDVDVVCPHAASTPLDGAELDAIEQVVPLRQRSIPVVTPKPLVGHSFGASGLLDLVYLIDLLRGGVLAGNPHLETPSESALPYEASLRAKGPANLRRALKTSYASGGSSAAVLLARPEGSG